MFISMQNNNFIPQFFLEILQRHCILVILSTLSMPGHTLSRVTVLIYRKLWWSLCKKSISSLTSFLGYCTDLQIFYFGYFGQPWLCPPRLMVSTYRIVWCSSACKKSTSYLLSFLRYCNDTIICYFGYFGHAWLWLLKTITPACRKLCLLSCRNHIYLSPLPSWYITKILQTYFGYFGHTWPRPPKAVVQPCKKLWCLFANKKSTGFFNDF